MEESWNASRSSKKSLSQSRARLIYASSRFKDHATFVYIERYIFVLYFIFTLNIYQIYDHNLATDVILFLIVASSDLLLGLHLGLFLAGDVFAEIFILALRIFGDALKCRGLLPIKANS